MPTEPLLILPIELIENRPIKEPIYCAGNVGYPEGFLSLQVKSKNATRFTTLPSFVKYHRRNCHVTATAELIGFSPSQDSNGTVIKCRVENNLLLSRDSDLSATQDLAVLPGE